MAYEELKQRQSVMWGTGPYQRITETIADIHETVIERLDPRPGERWLDLACGTGAVAERAAARGAQVTGLDLAPALIETAKERAAQLGLEIEYRVGDCERLALADASYDVVSSACGIMFAPDHAATARELARVARPGGRIALVNWTPHPRGVRALFAVMAPFPARAAALEPLRVGRRTARARVARRLFRVDIRDPSLDASASRPLKTTGSCSRPASVRRRRLRTPSVSGVRDCTEPGLISSRRAATARTERSSTSASICSCSERAPRRPRFGRSTAARL